jgi:hypothetical protein
MTASMFSRVRDLGLSVMRVILILPQVLLTVAALFATSSSFGAEKAFSFTFRADVREVELSLRGSRVLLYAFGTNQLKPYVRELYTLDGVNVLRDAPADHLHHHGLMYAIKVNGINFWEETKESGRQVPQSELTREVRIDAQGRQQASFSHVIHWVPPGVGLSSDSAASALLLETRTLTVTSDAASEELALQWESDFEVGQVTPRVTLTGTPYHGLGIRFPASFDRVALRENSAALPYTAEGREEVTSARWAVTSGMIGGRVYSIGAFHDPSNRGASRFFSMTDAFAYLSATQGLDESPLEYEAGDRFTLRYLVTVSPGTRASQMLDRRLQSWLESSRAE